MRLASIPPLLLLLNASIADANTLTPQAILDKVAEQNTFGFITGDAQVRMVLMDKGGAKRIRELNARAIKEGAKAERRILIRFKSPKDERGTAMLMMEHSDLPSDMYLYLPAYKRTRRIVGGDKKNSFVGSDFSYADMERTYFNQARAEQHSDKSVDGEDCYHLDVFPKDQSIYKKMELFVRKRDYLTQQIRYYDDRGQFTKVYRIQEVKAMKVGPVVTKAQMWTQETGHSTFFVVDTVDEATRLKQLDFRVESLPTVQ